MRPIALAFIVATAASAVGFGSCDHGSSSAPPTTSSHREETTLADLRQRPLHIAQLRAEYPCPNSRPRTISPDFGPGLGDGPVYHIGFSNGVLRFSYPPPKDSLFARSQWGGQKVLWVSDPAYDGPILIRGRQMDGPNQLRFGEGSAAILQELAFGAHGAGNLTDLWRNFPSYTRLRSPGCYAYQVDGDGFSDTVVFRAAVWGS